MCYFKRSSEITFFVNIGTIVNQQADNLMTFFQLITAHSCCAHCRIQQRGRRSVGIYAVDILFAAVGKHQTHHLRIILIHRQYQHLLHIQLYPLILIELKLLRSKTTIRTFQITDTVAFFYQISCNILIPPFSIIAYPHSA